MRLNNDDKLTPTQQKLWDAMADYKPHPHKELRALIDDQCSIDTLRYHICLLRTKVRQTSDELIIVEDGSYRRVRVVLAP